MRHVGWHTGRGRIPPCLPTCLSAFPQSQAEALVRNRQYGNIYSSSLNNHRAGYHTFWADSWRRNVGTAAFIGLIAWHNRQARRGGASRSCSSQAVEPVLQNLQALRKALASLHVDAFIIPTNDPHLSEVPPDCFARRAFISSFSGSAGVAVVTSDDARLWTDGRYFLQAEQELPCGWHLMRSGLPKTPKVSKWLIDNLCSGQTVGIDPMVHEASAVLELEEELKTRGVILKLLSANPVDTIWSCQPAFPSAQVRLHPVEFTGWSISEKLKTVRSKLEESDAHALVVSALDEVAYLLNIRGGDVKNTPVVMSYVIVEREVVTLFVDSSKIGEDVLSALKGQGVQVRPYEDMLLTLENLCKASWEDGKVWLDPEKSNYALYSIVSRYCTVVKEKSPVSTMKAKKNAAEIQGMRAAHKRDGAALAKSLCHLEHMIQSGNNQITEVDVDSEVTSSRSKQWGYLENSFDTIAGYGPNGAMIHYRAEPATAATLGCCSLFLLDSGAQYLDGTTDVTRTMHFGTPTAKEVECFTRVLQGHIALATATFPEGTPGFVVDAFARQPLWSAGLDYRHGTGHGVGAALAVHEGPQSISYRFENNTSLEAGMIVSNEPGYYADGEFGIRIENLLEVVEVETPYKFGDKQYLGFKPLTLVPIQKTLIDPKLLTEKDITYIDEYHGHVYNEIAPLLHDNQEALEWLRTSTAPLTH